MATLVDGIAGWIAAVCKRALSQRVLGVILPCESDRRDEEEACD